MHSCTNHALFSYDKTNIYNFFHSQATKQRLTHETSLDNGNTASPSHRDDLDMHEQIENSIPPQDDDCDASTPEEKILKVQ